MKLKKIAILQPNYIPWKGVFDMINKVDEFIFLDDVQFTKRDWRTRNYIKTSDGLLLLSIPVKHSDRNSTLINKVEIDSTQNWQEKHYKSILHSYSKSDYFSDFNFMIEEIYLKNKWRNLSEFNIFVTIFISQKILDIKTKFSISSEYGVDGVGSDRILNLCKISEATHYLSGPSAKDYLIIDNFNKNNISVEWMNYSNYREYQQQFPPFEHRVSVIDVFFNCGKNSKNFVFSYDTF